MEDDRHECVSRKHVEEVHFFVVITSMTVIGIVNIVASCIEIVDKCAPMKSLSRPMLIRIRMILQHLADGQRVTASHMARTLDVSARTIARDFDYMINGLDLPIRYEYRRRSYVLCGPLPSIFSVVADGKAKTASPAVKKRKTSSVTSLRSRRQSVSADVAK